MTLFSISGLPMHHGVGLGLEHQVLVLVSVLKKKSYSFSRPFRSHRSFQNGKESLTNTIDQILQIED